MCQNKSFIIVSLVVFVLSGAPAIADCPSADFTGDYFVDFDDFARMANQWLTGYDWNDVNTLANQWLTGYLNIPDDLVCIPSGEFEMGDSFSEGMSDELPVHPVFLDAFFMSKFEITNQKYCDYLNSVYGTDIWVSPGDGRVYGHQNYGWYCDTSSSSSYSQIDFNEVSETFSVRTKGGRDMNDDPMVMVTWCGSVAYCNWRSIEEGYEACYNPSTRVCDFNKIGYRLPTEAEWEYAARGGLSDKRFSWADPNITHSQANYYSSSSYSYDISPTRGFHPVWNDGIFPYTSVVGSFAANGYGLYDMVGNVYEFCNDWYSSTYYSTSPYDNPTGPTAGMGPVLRGGSWYVNAFVCRVAFRPHDDSLEHAFRIVGFRIVLDLE